MSADILVSITMTIVPASTPLLLAALGELVVEKAGVLNLGGAHPLYPAGAIALLTIGVNFIVDWMLAIHSRGHGEGV